MNEGIKQVIQTIYDEQGAVKPSALVDAARSKDSPAHSAFEWDNNKAGDEFRLMQARQYIRLVKIERAGTQERLIHVPAIKHEGEGEYLPRSVLVERPDEFERALQAAVSKLHAARRAVDDLREAAEKDPSKNRAAMIAQVSRGLEIMEAALHTTH
jgi:hypothetical protein